MRKVLWIALTATALSAGARADEPAAPSNPAPPAANPATPAPAVPEAPNGQVFTDLNPNWGGSPFANCAGHCPTCGRPMQCATGKPCEECGRRQRKIARILDWLIYVPLDHGKTKCCGCRSEPPPAWCFFPCEGRGNCTTCVAGTTAYYAKAAGATTVAKVQSAEPVTQTTAYPPPPVQRMPEPPQTTAYPPPPVQRMPEPPQTTAYPPPPVQRLPEPPTPPAVSGKPVAPSMPILDPSQFRRPANN